MPTLPLTMYVEHIFGPSLSMKIVYALGDDNHRTALLSQPRLTLCYSQMGSVGFLAHHQLPSVMVELPDPRRSAREGFWSGQVLRMHQHIKVLSQGSKAKRVAIKSVIFRRKN